MSALNKGFSIELSGIEHISEIVLSDDSRKKVLICGVIGQVLSITLVEETVLVLHCDNGDIRIDIDVNRVFELCSKIQGDTEVEMK